MNQRKLVFGLSESLTDTASSNLEVYPNVILQLTTISLLFTLTSTAASIAPAIVSEATPQVAVANETFGREILPLKNEVKIEDYLPISDSENVEKFVTRYFANTPILAHIAGCESHYRQLDSKGNVLRGRKNRHDIGVMQINELYHLEDAEKLGLDIYTIEGNVAFAKKLYDRFGAKPWMSSSACWAKFTESEIARK